MSQELTEDVQLNEHNRNEEMREAGKCACANQFSSHQNTCQCRRLAAVTPWH